MDFRYHMDELSADELSGKELSLIEVLGSGDEDLNQREIARETGFSLGMTNILLKRLIKKGYVKVVGLNGRTLRYILTVQGFKEKLKRSYNFVVYSFQFLDKIKKQIQSLFVGFRDVDLAIYIVGSNEMGKVAQEALREIGLKSQFGVPADKPTGQRVVVLICEMVDEGQHEFPDGCEIIDMDRLIGAKN